MVSKWRYIGEKFGIPFGIWLITSSITQIFRKYANISMIKSLFQTFVIELWPIWIGAICVAFYLIGKSLINFLRDYKSVENSVESTGRKLSDKINKVEVNINELKEWIGRFSYQNDKGSYSDLRGKIKRYIQEELEKESLRRVSVDVEITRKISNLESEIQDIRTRIPRRAITTKD